MQQPPVSHAPVERRANATFGPSYLMTGYPLRYQPRYASDHYPWFDPFSRIRWAHDEVTEQKAA